MKPGTTISVALATYNGERFLEEQLASLANQVRLPDELVVSDDGSTDGTLRILDTFAATAPFPVRILRDQARLNYRGNFMRAAVACGGDLIAFVDQDDVWYPTKLEKAVALLEGHAGAMLAYHDVDLIDEAGKVYGTPVYQADPLVWPHLAMAPWTVRVGMCVTITSQLLPVMAALFEHSLDPNVASRDEQLAHDQLAFIAANGLGPVLRHADALAGYRQHGSSVTGIWGKGVERPGFLKNHGPAYARMGQSADLIADAFGRMAGEKWPLDSKNLERAAAHWRSIAQTYSIRATLYQCPSMAGRVRALLALLGRRTYGRGPHRLALQSLVKDSAHVILGS